MASCMKDASAGSSFDTTVLAVRSAFQRLVVSSGCGDVMRTEYTCSIPGRKWPTIYS